MTVDKKHAVLVWGVFVLVTVAIVVAMFQSNKIRTKVLAIPAKA